MRPMILALVFLVLVAPAGLAGPFGRIGGHGHVSPAPKFAPALPTWTPAPAEPRELDELRAAPVVVAPLVVAPPAPPELEPPPKGELVECGCRCADGACADGQGGLCLSGSVDSYGAPMSYACR